MSDVIAKVISQKGTCEAQHKVGDEFVIGQQTPPNLCSWAFTPFFLVPKSCNLAVRSPGSKTETRLLLPVLTQQTRWCLN